MSVDMINKLLKIFLLWKKEELFGKNPLLSRTIWVNVIAILGTVLFSYTGIILTPEMQVGILALVNIALRFISKKPIGLWENKSESVQDKNEHDGSEEKNSVGQGRDGFPTHTGDG